MGDFPKSETGPGPDPREARNIVLLRRLVTALAVVMVLGMLALVGLMAARLLREPPLPLPETIELPDGAKASAVTVAKDVFLIVTEEGRILIYDRDTAKLRQEITLD